MSVRTITVHVAVYTDQEEQADYILLNDKDIAEREKADQKRLSEAENLEALPEPTDQEKARAKYLREQVSISKRILAHQRSVRDEIIPYAEKRTYTLLKPKWRDYCIAEEESRTLHDDGDVTTDRTKLMVELMPKALIGGGLSKEEVEDLDPGIMAYLWEKLYGSLWPDPMRLGFLSPGAATR